MKTEQLLEEVITHADDLGQLRNGRVLSEILHKTARELGIFAVLIVASPLWMAAMGLTFRPFMHWAKQW